jgi:hypothetical protein
MNLCNSSPIFDASQQYASSDDVLQSRAELFEGRTGNLEAPTRLRCRVSHANGLSIESRGAVPATATTLPMRTAREIPTIGS